VIERVLADQHWRKIALNDPERGEAALHRRCFADPEGAVIAMDPDPGAALFRPVPRRPADWNASVSRIFMTPLSGILFRTASASRLTLGSRWRYGAT